MSTQTSRTRRMPAPSRRPAADPLGDVPSAARGAADAALLVSRVSDELAELSLVVADLQAALATALAAAAEHDPAVMLQAQKLDLVTQWLGGLTRFLSGLQHRRIGCEPLDFDALAATLDLKSLGERLAGRVSDAPDDGFELF